MSHGYKNILSEERITVSLFQTGNPTFNTILTDWFFGGGEQHFGSALISGNGSQTGSVLKGGRGSALVSVTGALLAIGVAGMIAIASISGGGSQVATGKKATVGSAIVSGNGSLVSEGRKNGQSLASVSANGQLTSSGIKSTGAVGQVSANGLLQGEGLKQGLGNSFISGNGSLYAEGFQPESYSGKGIISVSGELSGMGNKGATGVALIHTDRKEIPIALLSDGKLSKKISNTFYIKL